MSSTKNRVVREELERIYGHKCMLHEGLKIKGYSKSKANYKGKSILKQLTLHHLKPKREGGKATLENGAVLCRACHDYLEQTDSRTREELNNSLRQYKRNIDNRIAETEAMQVVIVPEEDVEQPFEVSAMLVESDKSRTNIG